MKKSFLKKSFLISLLIIFISLASCRQDQKLPEKAKEVGLENTHLFNEPMLIKIEDANGIREMYGKVWENFLIKEGYLERVIISYNNIGNKEVFRVTNKLRPFIVSEDSSFFWGIVNWEWNVKVAKYQLKSIDKVEKIIDGDDDLWRFSFTYFLEPIISGLQILGPYKGYSGARFNRWKEEWGAIDDYEYQIKVESSNAISEYGKWLWLKENPNDKTGN